MVILIAGCSYTGKTRLAQKLLEHYKYTYLSLDHLKMGLIRSGTASLTPYDDAAVEALLWPIVREIVKTAVENRQNLIVEGCYIPFTWKESFDGEYLKEIRYYCLVMTENYINARFEDIKKYADVIEKRLDSTYCVKEELIRENSFNMAMCEKHGCRPILIDNNYEADIESGLNCLL